MELSAVIVVPARDEESTIAGCLSALAVQTIGMGSFETIIVLDDCHDATAEVAEHHAAELGLVLRTLPGPARGAGAARGAGMDAAARRLLELGRPDALIACTDADSQPAPDWLERQLAHVAQGARAIAGLIELHPAELDELPAGVRRRRERDAAERLVRVRRADPGAHHHHFAGASLGVTASAYREVGGLEPVAALEDAKFAVRLEAHGVSILRASDVLVRTSARSRGRVRRGLSVDLEVSIWGERRRYRAGDFDVESLLERKRGTRTSVIIPAKDCAATVAGVVRRTVAPLADLGLVDEVLVVDADPGDGTAAAAAEAGARVVHEDELMPELGPALGKGDAMWRGLAATRGELVCFLDADTSDPDPAHLLGLLGPLLSHPELSLVKGTFDRPLRSGHTVLPHEGGRVTELMARPLLNLHAPQLSGFTQPLAGEFAARRGLLESLSFPVGYGVEIAILIDALRRVGLDALAECDLGTRQNRHQPLRALGEMAYAVLAAVERRVGSDRSIIAGAYLRPWEDGRVASVPVLERPALSTLKRGEDLSAVLP
jgi:glycosyltransferase involved in cell wall biosynthesis